jgi:hypothetical protein
LLVPVVLALLAMTALFFAWQLFQRNRVLRQSSNSGELVAAARTMPSRSAQANTALTEPTGPAPAAVKTDSAESAARPPQTALTPSPATPHGGIDTNAPMPAKAATASADVPTKNPPAVPKPPPLRLQVVIYNPSRPSAMINGKTLFIGDHIGEFRLAALTPESATLTSAAETNVLTLP